MRYVKRHTTECHLGDILGSSAPTTYTPQWKTPARPGSFCVALDTILACIGIPFYAGLVLLVLILLFSTAGMKRSYSAEIRVPANAEEGIASVDHGKPTRFDSRNYHGRVATGEHFNAKLFGVAHRTLPLRSCIMIARGPRVVQATIRDRGPCLSAHCQRTAPRRVRVRILDLWPAVARRLACDGLCRVKFWPVLCGVAL